MSLVPAATICERRLRGCRAHHPCGGRGDGPHVLVLARLDAAHRPTHDEIEKHAEEFESEMEDPMRVGRDAEIPLHEIVIRASRSSGPGGQHANTTASRIEAVFDVAASAALSDEQKRRIIARCGPRVVAIAQDTRNQTRNRELALGRLRHRLEASLHVARPRTATRPTRSSKRRRLDAKLRQAERKRQRRPPGAEDG